MARTLRLQIEDLGKWHPGFFLELHSVACAAVLGRHGPPPARIEVECLNVDCAWLRGHAGFRLVVTWSLETQEKARRLRATIQAKPLVEMGATALALAVAHRVLDLSPLDVTRYGDRTDYRSLRIPCMLEVSGTESPGELTRRHKQKIAQASRNPLGWDAYVIVCAFSAERHKIRVSFHRVQGPGTDA